MRARMCPGWLTSSFSCFRTADLACSSAAFRHPRTRVDGAPEDDEPEVVVDEDIGTKEVELIVGGTARAEVDS